MKTPEQWFEEMPHSDFDQQTMRGWIKRIQDDAVKSRNEELIQIRSMAKASSRRLTEAFMTDAVGSDQCKATVSTRQ